MNLDVLTVILSVFCAALVIVPVIGTAVYCAVKSIGDKKTKSVKSAETVNAAAIQTVNAK